jgi:thioesterase domain-containing protein
VSINRLKILDVLIEQLAQMKKRPEPALDTEPSDEQIDALIDQYQGQLRQAQATASAMPYKSAPASFTGAVVNLVA